jgi:hypothetical protein
MLASAIEEFLTERGTQADERGVGRWRWELELFQKVSGTTHLDQVCRADIFAYWQQYKNAGSAPRTIYNRVQSLLTFLYSKR